MNEEIESRTLWKSPDDDVLPLITIEASMRKDDARLRLARDDFQLVGMTVDVSVNGVTVGEDDVWGVEHGTVREGVEADAWELKPAQYPKLGPVIPGSRLSGVVVEALDIAQHWLTAIGANEAVQDAITAALAWADPHNPEREETDAQWLAHLFEAEVCAECGWDADQHHVALDPFGNRHAFCDDPVPEDLTDEQINREINRRIAISTSSGEGTSPTQAD